MDYPQLNLIFGLILFTTVIVNIGLRVLLSNMNLPIWMSLSSWLALLISILCALYIETLFLRLMTPAFNRQIVIGILAIGGIGALVVASLYVRVRKSGLAGTMFAAQILVSLLSIAMAFGLYRSLVAIPSP
jgi:hypothetical protein